MGNALWDLGQFYGNSAGMVTMIW